MISFVSAFLNAQSYDDSIEALIEERSVSGVVFLGKPIALRLLGASLAVLGGITHVVVDRRKVA